MKKLFLGAAVLLLFSWAILLITGIGLPTTESLAAVCEPIENSEQYLAENRVLVSCIYTADSNGKITRVYQEGRRSGERFSEISRIAGAESGVYFTRQIWKNNTLFPEDWELCLLSGGEVKRLGGGKDIAKMKITDLGVFYGEIFAAGITPDGSAVLCRLPEKGGEWQLIQQTAKGAINAAVSERGITVMFDDGRIAFCNAESEIPLSEYPHHILPDKISLSFPARVQCKAIYFVFSIIAVSFITTVSTALMLCLKSRTMVSRITLGVGICLLFTFVFAGTTFCLFSIKQISNQTINQAKYQTESSARTASGANSRYILKDDYCGSDEQMLMNERININSDTVFALRSDGVISVASGEYPYGTFAKSVLTDDELKILNTTAKGGTDGFSIDKNGRRWAVSAAPVSANGVVVGVLLSRIPVDISHDILMDFVSPMIIILLFMYIYTMIFAYIFLRFAMRPMAQLTQQMRAVSDGNLTANRATERNDELGELHDAMQEMCAGLSIRDYEVNSVIRSYKRFIPTGLHELLDRASVMEVSFGDSNSISGCVSLYSVNNREAARSVLNDDAFVDFVSGCFSSLYEQVIAHNGQMLSNGFDLNSIPVYYASKPMEALNAGLGLIGATEHKDSGAAPRFFQMLHHTTFMYGIAGVEDRVFPFFSSGEIEFLNSYAEKFSSIGVLMVATDAYIAQTDGLQGRCRYIGFVNSPDGKYSYKLYEMLDAYSDIDRTRRIRYDRQFQDAIRLFYHNDFYLARNQFSALLKSCPNDSIARWYLFACEQAFNSEPENVDYQLFGIR